MMLVIFAGLLGLIAGYCLSIDKDDCPAMILGYKCKGYTCNHSRYEIDSAKEQMKNRRPPGSFNFRP